MTDDIPADRSRGPASIAVPAIAGTLVCSALYAIYTPGLLNADSIDLLCQAIHRQYTDIHSPLMSIVWGWLNQISFGSAAMLLLIQVAYVTATILLAFQIANRTRTRLLAFAVLIAWPPILDFPPSAAVPVPAGFASWKAARTWP